MEALFAALAIGVVAIAAVATELYLGGRGRT